MENFWSLLKRALKGTYVSVEPFHLFRYLDEQAFRFNERKDEDGDAGRFEEILNGVTGKRLTYKQLTGKEDCAPPPRRLEAEPSAAWTAETRRGISLAVSRPKATACMPDLGGDTPMERFERILKRVISVPKARD